MKTAERFSQSLPDGLEIRAKAVLLFVKAEVQLHDRALEIADSLSETSAEAELVDRLNCGDDLPLFTADRHLKGTMTRRRPSPSVPRSMRPA